RRYADGSYRQIFLTPPPQPVKGNRLAPPRGGASASAIRPRPVAGPVCPYRTPGARSWQAEPPGGLTRRAPVRQCRGSGRAHRSHGGGRLFSDKGGPLAPAPILLSYKRTLRAQTTGRTTIRGAYRARRPPAGPCASHGTGERADGMQG